MTDLVGSCANPVAEERQEFVNISLETDGQKKTESKPVRKKQPRRILHFSDGILEEYSTDEEDEQSKPPSAPPVDPKTLGWFPWAWYYLVATASRSLSAADFCGEKLAWFFGITKPKYQYAIDEYYRLKEEEEREKARQERILRKYESEKLTDVNVEKTDAKPLKIHNTPEGSEELEKY